MPEERDPVVAFKAAAERYVALVETAGETKREGLLADLAAVLPVLYAAAFRLPSLGAEPEELSETARLTHEQWAAVFNRLQQVLGPDDLYWTVVPFGEEPREELAGSLADDLADIYRDVKEGLDLLGAGDSESEVVWNWHFSWWTHWGEHAVEALRIIHAHLTAIGGPPYDHRDE